MVSVKGSFSSSTPQIRAPQYHDIVSRMLQKQFVHACVWSLILSYVASFIFGANHGLWYLFPWSWTGIRSIGIFAAIFPVYILRKANLHVTPVTRPTMLGTFAARTVSLNGFRAIFAYVLSSGVLTRIWLNNCTPRNALSVVLTHKSYELPRLNERWLFLHVLAVCVGITGALLHLALDVDLLKMPAVKRQIPDRLQAALPEMGKNALILTTSTITITPVVYLIIRGPLFRSVLRIARLFYRLPKSTALPGWPAGFDLLFTSAILVFIICFFWTSLNKLFDIYLSQGPSKRGRLASEKSMLPDETLLTGLQLAKKPLTQLMAFQEIQIIAQDHRLRSRRQKIFETGSPEATLWLSIADACLKPITEAISGLQVALNIGQSQPAASANKQPNRTLPPGTTPVRVVEANIFKTGLQKSSALDKIKSQTSSIAENQQQIQEVNKISHNVSELVRTQVQTLTKPVEELIPTDPGKAVERLTTYTFDNYEVQLLAVSALTDFLLASLQEDTYGRVYKDVTRILMEFLSLLRLIEAYLNKYTASAKAHVLREPIALKSALDGSISSVGQAFDSFVDFSTQPVLANQIQGYKRDAK